MVLKNSVEKIARRTNEDLEKLEHTADAIYSKLVTERKWFVVLSAAVVDFWERKLYYYTGHFTYNALLAVVALFFALTAVVGLVLRAHPSLQGDMREAVKAIIPVIGGTPAEATKSMVANTAVVGVIGFLGLLWTGTKIFGSLEYGFCQIWGIKRRKYVKGKVLGFLLIAVAGVIVILSIIVQFAFAAVWGWMVGTEGFWYSAGTFVIRPLIGLAVNFALFLFIYQVIPPIKQALRRSAVGAIISAAFFLALQYLLAFYFGSISNLPSVYGSVATIVVLAIWLHITGMIIFLGAEIIHAIYDEDMVEEHKQKTRLPKHFRPADEDDVSPGQVRNSADKH
ncbi:MAG: YihY/virulence factor BrkB family protein [Candidatus Geothermincolia bacterium]